MRSSVKHLFHFHTFLAVLAPLLTASALAKPAAAQSTVAQSAIVSQSEPAVAGIVCAKCGRVHASSASGSSPAMTVTSTPAAGPIATVSYQNSGSSGIQNVLSMLNGQRSRQGLRSLRYDAALQAVAERRARQMASMGIKSHPPGSFSPGRYEGVGWSSSYSPSGVHACYTSDPNMTAAGAAMVSGRDGVYFAVVYR